MRVPRQLSTLVMTGLLCSVSTAPGWAQEKPAPVAEQPRKTAEEIAKERAEIEAKIRGTLNASGPAIDRCTTAYLSEQPGQKGKASVKIKVIAEGRIGRVSVETALPQARTLRSCLEIVAKSWRFPEPKTDKGEDLGLDIPVEKGSSFRLLAAGEKPKARKPGEKPSGFLNFMPSFLNQFLGQ